MLGTGKKIVIVLPNLKGNGAERVMLNLADEFISLGHDVHLFIFENFIELPVNKKIKVHVFKKHYRIIPKSLRGSLLAPLLDKFIINKVTTPDLVLSNLMPVDRILSKSKLKNVFIVLHNILAGYRVSDKYSEKRNFNLIKKIYTHKTAVAVSEAVLKDFQFHFNENMRISVIHNPIHKEKLIASSNKGSKEKIIGGSYVINYGKFKTQKRHDLLLKAYKKSQISEKLVLIGNGPLLEECKKLSKDLDLKQNVIFMGFKENPFPILKNAKFMIMSSDFEGLAMVTLESLALGIPVVSTNAPGQSEILPMKNLCKPGSIDGLSELITQASENPDDFKVNLPEKFTSAYAARRYLQLISTE